MTKNIEKNRTAHPNCRTTETSHEAALESPTDNEMKLADEVVNKAHADIKPSSAVDSQKRRIEKPSTEADPSHVRKS